MTHPKPPIPREQTPRPFGPFVLQRRIAIGGTAEVFHARPRSGLRPAPELVIKRLLPNRDGEEQYEALSREAELHRAVRHENVVTVYGAGMVGREPYLAMEYVAGVDLHRLLRLAESETRSLPPLLAVYVARSVALALHAVHSACDAAGAPLNITHGDVSPSNIYLSLEGDVKLGDFGVAHAAGVEPGPSPEKNDSLKGKFGYIAPEQLIGDAFDRRSDIFALGVVLGEMLVGAKIFPGNGQLAVLLSIREANIEPLRRAREKMPAALYQSCARALAKNPEDRFADAAEFADSLSPWFDAQKARRGLAELVARALDGNAMAQKLEQRMLRASGVGAAASAGPSPTENSSVRRAGELIHENVSFARVIELAATGQLRLDDEVSLMGAQYRKVEEIEEFARHLMPSTTTTTGQLFQPGLPDFAADLAETPMLDILARLRMRRETGALFIARSNRDAPDRKDMYLRAGRLLHVASSDPDELLGQYMVRHKLLPEADLQRALGCLHLHGGKLGDTLVGLGLAEPTTIFRAIRNQGRDRVASLCSWREGRVHLYRGAEPGRLEFPLDLDLTVPMMAGAMLQLRLGVDPLAAVQRLHPGRRCGEAASEEELGGAPPTLVALADLLRTGPALAEAMQRLMQSGAETGRSVSDREARSAVIVAVALEWARAE